MWPSDWAVGQHCGFGYLPAGSSNCWASRNNYQWSRHNAQGDSSEENLSDDKSGYQFRQWRKAMQHNQDDDDQKRRSDVEEEAKQQKSKKKLK